MKYAVGFLAAIFTLLCASGCQNKASSVNAELLNIELLRGDIIVCSGQEFGDVSFSLSCDISVRKAFDLALSLLHSFQYSEAEKAFVKVLDADPECAMAYWGVAMSIYHAAWFPPSEVELIKASKILSIAKSLEANPREKDYLAAIGAFYAQWDNVDHQTRAKSYERKMGDLYQKYPDDPEAAILYSLALYSTRDRVGKDYVNELKAGKILEALFAKYPNHPGIAHYIIHNYDNPELAPKALEVARRYARIAPGSSHAQHMPSHIFTRLGLWDESIQSNLSSMSAVRCYVEEAGIEGHFFEEFHAMDYLVYAYLQQGNNKKAIEQYEYLKGVHDFNPFTMTATVYPLAAIPTRIAIENKNWAQAANIVPTDTTVDWKRYPWHNAIMHFGRALGSAHTGDFKSAAREIEILKQLKLDLVNMHDPTTSTQIDQVAVQITAAQAWLSFKQGDQEAGLALMQEAAELEGRTSKHPITPGDVVPADELLGDMLLEMNRPAEALVAYERDLQGQPNRFNGIYGAAVAAKRSGQAEKSKLYFEQLLNMADTDESNRPELVEAKQM
jgi:hypothetical protein